MNQSVRLILDLFVLNNITNHLTGQGILGSMRPVEILSKTIKKSSFTKNKTDKNEKNPDF